MEPPEEVLPFQREISLIQMPFHECKSQPEGEVLWMGASLWWEELGSTGNRFWFPGLESPVGPPTLPAYQPLFPDSPGYPLLNVVQLLLFVSFPNLCSTFVPCRFQIAERFIRPQ